MRAYSSFTAEEKEKIYSLARAGVSDDAIAARYNIDEHFLLRICEEVFVQLQERRGYRGAFVKNGFFRDDELC